jgi:ribose/xylose/arabinose/galactoside ABC-type transport system permease subunit
MKSIKKKRTSIATLGTVIVFSIICVMFSFLSPAFLSLENIIGTCVRFPFS